MNNGMTETKYVGPQGQIEYPEFNNLVEMFFEKHNITDKDTKESMTTSMLVVLSYVAEVSVNHGIELARGIRHNKAV